MKEKIKLSIIVPAYNVAPYLPECLDSLLAQTLKGIEVLLVNDGATDKTPDILQDYAKRYPKLFTYYDKPNGGVSDARNFGVPHAKGEYLCFLDSDDYVLPDTYQLLYDKAKEEDSDIVLGNLIYFFTDGKTYEMAGLAHRASPVQKDALLSPLFSWNKLFRTSFYKAQNFQFPLKTWYEDLPVITRAFLATDKISFVPEAKFYYRQHASSIMASNASPRIIEIFEVMKSVYDIFKDTGNLEAFHDELEYLFVEHLRLYGQYRFLRSPDYKSLCSHGFALVDSYFPDWKHNKYLKSLTLKERIFLRTNHELTLGIYRLYLNRH
ncbi:MAG: glycosyltransferase [Erysipelotrichaceae bacterium]|jgi:glycosyltransferase involved in cell wall biosynthesis|nr:glycosyltransferase [Erysipelotrichaceae bacterium]